MVPRSIFAMVLWLTPEAAESSIWVMSMDFRMCFMSDAGGKRMMGCNVKF